MSPFAFTRKNRASASPSPDKLSTTRPTDVEPRNAADNPVRTAEQAGAKCTPPKGGAHFALGPAPAGAGTGPAHGAGTEAEVEAERGLHPEQDQQLLVEPSEPANAVARFAPTVSADAFVHGGIAANDLPAPDRGDSAPGAEQRRRLSRVLNRPRSGAKLELRLTCSASIAEKEYIDATAKAADLSRSAFIMNATLAYAHAYLPDQRPEGVTPLPSPQAVQDLMVLFGKLIREFGRIGTNLNQIVRAMHSGQLPDRAMDVLDELHQAARLTRLALEQVLAGGGRRGA